jgi:hypothetical protein
MFGVAEGFSRAGVAQKAGFSDIFALAAAIRAKKRSDIIF